ncbi:MAG: alpha/beta fold hydrolase [Oscillospiraceae bacterium]|nr:alpha/beta fold hydrolase [Oscillospiraceae bacterium]
MTWVWIALMALAALFALVYFVGGYIAFRGSLRRRKVKGASSRMQAPDPNLQLRHDMEAAGRAWFFGQNPEEAEIRSYDGLALRGYYLPAARPSDKLAVFAHGYSYNGPDQFGALLPFYHEGLNYNILLPDQRAHGRSGGDWIGFSAMEWRDILDWAAAFAQRLGPDTQVVLHGISMGGATVMNCNAHNPPDYIKCVVEDCGYTNGYEMIALVARRDLRVNLPPMLWGALFWFRAIQRCSLRRDADPYGSIGKCKLPTLFIHGADDRFVPAEMGLRCFEAAAVPKELLLVEGAGHSMSYFMAKEAYEEKVRGWLARWVGETVGVSNTP